MLCSKIPQPTAKSLLGHIVTLLEVSSGKQFKAKVIDYCFEGQHGFIVELKTKDAKQLDSYKLTGESDRGATMREIDLRDVFNGHLFRILT